MGDVVTFEKAQQAIDEEEANKLAEKMKSNQFNLQDFQNQMKQIKKMGPISDIVKMIPGANKIPAGSMNDNQLMD